MAKTKLSKAETRILEQFWNTIAAITYKPMMQATLRPVTRSH
jgi:hypothetical protein